MWVYICIYINLMCWCVRTHSAFRAHTCALTNSYKWRRVSVAVRVPLCVGGVVHDYGRKHTCARTWTHPRESQQKRQRARERARRPAVCGDSSGGAGAGSDGSPAADFARENMMPRNRPISRPKKPPRPIGARPWARLSGNGCAALARPLRPPGRGGRFAPQLLMYGPKKLWKYLS